MTKKHTSTPETVSSDYVLMQVTLTLAVESYLCDEHSEMRDEAACANCGDEWSLLSKQGYCPECQEQADQS